MRRTCTSGSACCCSAAWGCRRRARRTRSCTSTTSTRASTRSWSRWTRRSWRELRRRRAAISYQYNYPADGHTVLLRGSRLGSGDRRAAAVQAGNARDRPAARIPRASSCRRSTRRATLRSGPRSPSFSTCRIRQPRRGREFVADNDGFIGNSADEQLLPLPFQQPEAVHVHSLGQERGVQEAGTSYRHLRSNISDGPLDRPEPC